MHGSYNNSKMTKIKCQKNVCGLGLIRARMEQARQVRLSVASWMGTLSVVEDGEMAVVDR
jgi:N-acetylglucosamine kinase-like BadF-type ATPase